MVTIQKNKSNSTTKKLEKSSTQSQATYSTNGPDFLKGKREEKVFNTGLSKFYLVVDLGGFLIKYSLFAVYDKSRAYLLSFELKDSTKIVEDGVVNYNLFKRDLARKLESLSEVSTDIEVIVIPLRTGVMSKPVPGMELKDKKSEMLKDIKAELKEIFTPEGVYDWSLLKQDNERDVNFIYLENISSMVLFPILTTLVELKVKKYQVVSPILSLIPLTGYTEEVTMLVDIGHDTVGVTIIKDSVIMYTNTISTAGREMNNKFNIPLVDAIKIKHSSLIEELPTEVHAVFDTIKREVQKIAEEYNKGSIDKINSVKILGGHANSNIESVLGLDSLRVPVTYVDLDIENSKLIPREVRNYLLNSYGALMNEVDSEFKEIHDYIDYSAPKDSMIMRIKKLSQGFNNNKKSLIALTATALLALGIASFAAKQTNDIENQYSEKVQTATSEISSLTEQITVLDNQYNTLMSSSNAFTENENVGDLIDYIASITPPNFNIKEFSLNSSSNTGLMKVTSDSELVTSTFVTLLQDPSNGAFNKVNIVKVEIDEVGGEKYYNTYLYLEGRKF